VCYCTTDVERFETMKSHYCLLVFLLLSALGCGDDDPLVGEATVTPNIQFHLAPAALSQEAVNITRIELTVSAPDITPPIEVVFTDVDVANRAARGTVSVPAGRNRTFLAKAFDGDCPVLRGGAENVDVGRDAPEIVLALEPATLIIGVRTVVSQLSFGEMGAVEVYIEDAPPLFGFTCELAYDERSLTPFEVKAGDFFGGEDERLFLSDRDFSRQPGRLTLGISRKRGTSGVCGSGVAFEVVFYALDPGTASIALIPGENLVLTTPDAQNVAGDRITIAPGITIDVQ